MSEAIKFTCPHCERICKVPAELGGKQGRCPGCKKGLEVPTETPEHLLSGRLSSPSDLPPPPPSEVRPGTGKATHADGSRPDGRASGGRASLLPRKTSGRNRRRSGGRRSARLSDIEEADDFAETGPILCKACRLNVPAGANVCPHCKVELRKVSSGGLHWSVLASFVFAVPIPILGLLLAQLGLRRARERKSYETLAWVAILVSGANLCFGLLYMLRAQVS